MRRKSSRSIVLGAAFTVTAAAILIAVVTYPDDPEVVADCVEATPQPDGSHLVVPDSYCGSSSTVVVVNGSSYQYVYGATSSGRYARGGTLVRPTGVTITTRSGTTVVRGGFGGRGGSGS
ncbi:hypothetical protein ACIBH1_45355 [Nonomuraea sp. NPDC050663]|uniref:hypothetical protein n=1 Tax=Nonomuraea sp. NPDC050663 TaxID=3364370 RepID=UPI0037A83391